MNDYTVVVNAGSSSLKFSVYRRAESDSWTLEARGQVEGIGTSPKFSAKDGADKPIGDVALDPTIRDARAALGFVANWLRDRYHGAHVCGVGHRVVHGGAQVLRSDDRDTGGDGEPACADSARPSPSAV